MSEASNDFYQVEQFNDEPVREVARNIARLRRIDYALEECTFTDARRVSEYGGDSGRVLGTLSEEVLHGTALEQSKWFEKGVMYAIHSSNPYKSVFELSDRYAAAQELEPSNQERIHTALEFEGYSRIGGVFTDKVDGLFAPTIGACAAAAFERADITQAVDRSLYNRNEAEGIDNAAKQIADMVPLRTFNVGSASQGSEVSVFSGLQYSDRLSDASKLGLWIADLHIDLTLINLASSRF